MADKKIVVPEGMYQAAMTERANSGYSYESMLRAALTWLSENPIVPTAAQVDDMATKAADRQSWEPIRWMVSEWQRRMFLAPEPTVPKEVADLLVSMEDERRGIPLQMAADTVNSLLVEAFRRGQKSSK